MHRRNALGGSNGPPLRRHLLRTPRLIAKYPCWWLWWWMEDSDCWSGKGARSAFDGGSGCAFIPGVSTA
jgi:hypothetical protein